MMNMEKDLIEVQRLHLSNLMKEIDVNRFVETEDQFKVIYTYDAVSMEGNNKIPFEEVGKLLKHKKLPDFSERDQKEILNHYQAFDTVLKWVEEKKPLTEDALKDLHEILVRGIFQGGTYRNVNIQIYGATHQPPDNVKVYDRMAKYFDKLEHFEGNMIEKAVYAHAALAKIHPFLDGNGRLARLVMNYYLLKGGYLAISIPLAERDEYIKHLETFKVDKNSMPLTLFIERLLLERYENMIESLEI